MHPHKICHRSYYKNDYNHDNDNNNHTGYNNDNGYYYNYVND